MIQFDLEVILSLKVLSAGPFTTLQDGGRAGYERFGVAASGAMDWFALRAANRLVGNPPGAAVIEFTLDGLELEAQQDFLAAVTGRGFRLWIEDRRIGLWMAAWVRAGERLSVRIEDPGQPGWGYLSVSGEPKIDPVLGSFSTALRAGLGGLDGRALQPGDIIPIHGDLSRRDMIKLAGRRYPPENRPHYADAVTIPVVLGPQSDWFQDESVAAFLSEPYTVTRLSDRMGYRLEGVPLKQRRHDELLSEGMPVGSVQVPASGQPMLMMSDRPTTGGYPKIAVAARCGLPLAAQLPLGRGVLRFKSVPVDEARELYRQVLHAVDEGMVD